MAEETKKKKKRPSALKRDIQNEKKRQQNRAHKSKIRTATREFEKSLSEKADQKVLQEKLSSIFSLYDKGVKKNVIKQNKAARHKSNLSNKLVSFSA